MKKLTIEDIIANKDKIKEGKTKKAKIFVDSLGGYAVFDQPDRQLLADSMQIDNGAESNIHVVYNTMVEPNLKDKDAQKAFGVHTPKELLQAILSDGEIGVIAENLMTVAGYNKDTVRIITDEVKN